MSSLVPGYIEELVPYQPGKPIEDVERELGLSEVIKLASNENPLGTAPRARAAVERALDEVRLYPDGDARRLKAALSERFGFDRSEILLGNGSNDIIELLLRTFMQPGRNVVSSAGAFAIFKLATRALGFAFRESPMTPDCGYDLDAMAERVDEHTRIVFLANPNNPTGSSLGAEELARFVERVDAKCPDDPPIIVHDEAYREYVDRPDYPDGPALVRRRPRTVVMRTFSKAYGLAGIRCGYAFADPELVDYVNRVRAPFNVNHLAQAAGEAALGDDDFVARSVAQNRDSREHLTRALRERGLGVYPTQANFLLVDFHRDGQEVFEALQRQGVIVRPLKPYGLTTHQRVTIGTPEQIDRLLGAIDAAGLS